MNVNLSPVTTFALTILAVIYALVGNESFFNFSWILYTIEYHFISDRDIHSTWMENRVLMLMNAKKIREFVMVENVVTPLEVTLVSALMVY